jgi:FMN reductase
MTNFVTIIGSVTPPGRLTTAITGLSDRAIAAGHASTVFDLRTVKLGFADGTPTEKLTDDTPALVASVSGAEAVILATPVYRATLTGALKNALDLLPVEALLGKPVGIIAMGATAHHFLGAESHLRDILSWFGALTAPTAVYLASADFTDGVLSEKAVANLDSLLRTLSVLAAIEGRGDLGPTPLAAVRR